MSHWTWRRKLERTCMVLGMESVGIPELDALIKMLMPDKDPEEEVEKEV